MQHVLALVAIIWLVGGTTSFAQVSGAAGMGPTSPLGTVASNSASQSNSIPLAATELNPRGLSPLPCAAAAQTGNQTPRSTFDGGGGVSNSMVQTACGSSASFGLGAAPPIAGSGSTTGLSSNQNIPLDSTELATPGESPVLTLPEPAASSN
jgi:hypothetical protein